MIGGIFTSKAYASKTHFLNACVMFVNNNNDLFIWSLFLKSPQAKIALEKKMTHIKSQKLGTNL